MDLRRPVEAPGVLLERDREVGLLDQLVERTRAGDAVLALFEGPAGIGKSSLLAEACKKAAVVGFGVLVASGSDLERDLPCGVVRQLLESLLMEPERRQRWRSGSAVPRAPVFAAPEEDETTRSGGLGCCIACSD